MLTWSRTKSAASALISALLILFAFEVNALAASITISGEITSTTLSQKGNAISVATHPFTIIKDGDFWKIRMEDRDVTDEKKLGPEYIECSYDGHSIFTKFIFTKQMRMKMAEDPDLKKLQAKNPQLSKAKADYDQAKATRDANRLPLNTNDASVYIDTGTYPKRLLPAGKALWMAYCSENTRRTNTADFIRDPFSLGAVFWRYEPSQHNMGELMPKTMSFTQTQNVTTANQLAVGNAVYRTLSTTNMAETSIQTGWELVKEYPKRFSPKAGTPYHVFAVSNAVVSVVREPLSILPKLDSPTYIEDKRFRAASLGYIETNNAYLTDSPVGITNRLQQISKLHTDRAKAVRATGKRRWQGILTACLVFIPLITMSVWLLRKEKNKTTK